MPLNHPNPAPLVRRLWAAGLLATSLWAAQPAWPMTLGEPRVVSASASGWVAEVPLRSVSPDTLAQIQARLAPPSAWAMAQLSAPNPNDFRLSVHDLASGPVLRIESDIGSGFVDLLIELQWPRGRLLRELGVLLDPAASGRIQGHAKVPLQIAVQAGDTAGALALSHLDSAQTLSQALLALQQANPDAFLQGNVNRLRADATLRLPTREQIKAVDLEQAREIIAQQMEEFAQYRAELAGQSGPDADPGQQAATGRVQPSGREPSGGDRLTLSAPGATDGDPIAAQRQAEQTAQRAAEINRNIQELNRLVQGGETGALSSPLPLPDQPPQSEWISRWVQNPNSSWAALALVLTLAAWVLLRVLRRPSQPQAAPSPPPPSAPVSPSPIEPSLPALKVDFDLDLPPTEGLPALPESVHQAPTPAFRTHRGVGSDSPVSPFNPAQTMAGLSLDLPSSPEQDREASPDEYAVRWALVQALWDRGLNQTARVLARELQDQAPAEWSNAARQWLNERS